MKLLCRFGLHRQLQSSSFKADPTSESRLAEIAQNQLGKPLIPVLVLLLIYSVSFEQVSLPCFPSL